MAKEIKSEDNMYTNNPKFKDIFSELDEEMDNVSLEVFTIHLKNSINKSIDFESYYLDKDTNQQAYSDLIKFRKGIFATSNRGDRKPAAGHIIMFDNSSGKIKEDRLLSSKNEVETPVLKIFSHGLKREIFDNEDVINSFENLATKIYKKNPKRKKELIEIIVKEEENNFKESISKSDFYKKIKALKKKFKKKIIKFYLIKDIYLIKDKCQKVSPKYLIAMEEKFHFPFVFERLFKVIDNKTSTKIKDIHTFEIFDGKWVRVRTDNKRKQHSSSALIDCLLPRTDLEKIDNLFEFLKGEDISRDITKVISNRYDELNSDKK